MSRIANHWPGLHRVSVALAAIVGLIGLIGGLVVTVPTRPADASVRSVSTIRSVSTSSRVVQAAGLPLVDISPGLPYNSSTDYASAAVQVQYGPKGSMQIGWLIGPVATAGATGHAIVTMYAKINGRTVAWFYGPKVERADYVFHSSIGSFQYGGDAPWTHHRLKAGDSVELHIYSDIPQVNRAHWYVKLDAIFRLM